MDRDRIIEMAVSDAITEKPLKFNIGKRRYTVNPPTIGKLQVLSKYYLALDLNDDALGKEPIKEAMRVCEEKPNHVCLLMAAATFDKKEDLLDDKKIGERAEFFKWNTNVTDFSTVILTLISQTGCENFIASIRLTQILRQNKPKVSRAGRVER